MAFFVDPKRPLKPRGHAIRLNQSSCRYVTTDIDVSAGSRDGRRVDRSNCSIPPIARCTNTSPRSDVCSQLAH